MGRPRTEWPITTRRDPDTDAGSDAGPDAGTQREAAAGATAAAWGRAAVGKPRSSRAKIPLRVALPYGCEPSNIVSTAIETRAQPRTSSATWWSSRPVPYPHPPLKYSFQPGCGSSPIPQRSAGAMLRSSRIA